MRSGLMPCAYIPTETVTQRRQMLPEQLSSSTVGHGPAAPLPSLRSVAHELVLKAGGWLLKHKWGRL